MDVDLAGGFGRRRGFGRAAAVLAFALIGLLASVSGCGDSGRGAETNPEKGTDARILNEGLSRELTLVDLYTRARLLLRGPQRAVSRQLRAQEQEYVDALTKAVRGLGGDTEAEPEELDPRRSGDRTDLLRLAYELESAALAFYVESAAHLYTTAPRTLDTSLAAGHAQHLVLLRQALGVPLSAAAPEGFDGGQVPLPAGTDPSGGG